MQGPLEERSATHAVLCCGDAPGHAGLDWIELNRIDGSIILDGPSAFPRTPPAGAAGKGPQRGEAA